MQLSRVALRFFPLFSAVLVFFRASFKEMEKLLKFQNELGCFARVKPKNLKRKGKKGGLNVGECSASPTTDRFRIYVFSLPTDYDTGKPAVAL